MGLKRWLARLDKTARDSFAGFELLDGTTFYYNPRSLDLFLHWYDCITAGNNPDRWPGPPEAVRALTQAKDPEAALERISGGGDWIPYDREALVRDREIRPVSLVAGWDLYDQDAVPDLSEPPSREDRF